MKEVGVKIIDLSKTIENDKKGESSLLKIKIKHKMHSKSKWIIRLLGGLPFKLFPSGFNGWADDQITKMGVHASTHLDAPWHYGPLCEGLPSKTVDEIPLEWCYGEGLVIDMSHKADFDPITVSDIEDFLSKHNLEVKPHMIILIRTDRDKMYTGNDFVFKGTGMSRAATEYFIDKGVKIMGIDQWGWDLPLPYMAKKAKKDNNSDYFWEGHLIGTRKEYMHIEQLTNLESLPITGFKVALFPLKIKGASAAPARVVAIIEN